MSAAAYVREHLDEGPGVVTLDIPVEMEGNGFRGIVHVRTYAMSADGDAWQLVTHNPRHQEILMKHLEKG